MKKRTKGILAFAFLGGIMVTSGVVIAIPGITPDGMDDPNFTETGTPADKFPDAQRAQFCGEGQLGSNTYVKEYKIPTKCTQPLAITSDFVGNIWFMQTNTGVLTKFDPILEKFTEFENPNWPPQGRSMVWGMDYSADNSIWYSDEAYDSVWRFSIDDERYQRLDFPSEGNALPQRLVVDGSQIIINDFTGNKLTFLDAIPPSSSQDAQYISIPSPVEQSVTAGFTKDSQANLWYTNWIPNMDGFLVKFDQPNYTFSLSQDPDAPLNDYLQVFKLPPQTVAINGIVADGIDNIWLVDTATSNFYSFDPDTESFTQYITSPVPVPAYGNNTGLIKSTPLSRPYWTGLSNDGQIIMNEQTSNRLGFFNPQNQKLTEYTIPSQNPHWADCAGFEGCGIAQIFDFAVVDDKVWFTEWATNNIGVLDTSIEPMFDVNVDTDKLLYDESTNSSSLTLQITANTDVDIEIIYNTVANESILVTPETLMISVSEGSTYDIPIEISTTDDVLPGNYKVLVGAQTDDLAVSEFITLIVG